MSLPSSAARRSTSVSILLAPLLQPLRPVQHQVVGEFQEAARVEAAVCFLDEVELRVAEGEEPSHPWREPTLDARPGERDESAPARIGAVHLHAVDGGVVDGGTGLPGREEVGHCPGAEASGEIPTRVRGSHPASRERQNSIPVLVWAKAR